MKRIIYLVCIHLLCCAAAQASNLRQISSREGISNNAILSLAQDKHGFIWVGSCDGLNMWDGERMRLFPNDWGGETPLSGNLIEEIAVTTDSLFWIRTNYGLDLFDPDSKRVERHADLSGRSRALLPSSPLRTVREGFPSYGSSFSKSLFVCRDRLILLLVSIVFYGII